MGNFYEQLGRFVVKLLIITLILLVSVQIISQDHQAGQTLRLVESKILDFFSEENRDRPPAEVTVTRDTPEEGYITINLINNLSLPRVWVLCNGQRLASFSEGKVSISVKPGDNLALDARLYPEPLWFEITDLDFSRASFSQTSLKIGQKFRTAGNIAHVGIVKVGGKL
ncbi:MAG: hypothetical protein ACOCZ3_03035 [Bacillota bacterium]